MKKILFVVLMLTAGAATAQPYALAGVGGSSENTVIVVGGGYRFAENVRAEIDYRDFAKSSHLGDSISGQSDSMEAKVKGFGASVLLTTSDTREAFGFIRLGMFQRNVDSTLTYAPARSLSPVSASEKATSTFYGVGFSALGLMVEGTFYGNVYPTPQGKINLSSATVSYRHDF